MHQPLDVERISRETTGLHLSPDLRYFDEVDSTNRIARDLSAQDWRSGTTVIADYQRAGRGRNGRGWHAPPGTALLLSLMIELPPASNPSEGLMMAAVATADAVSDTTGMAAALKWPNDVLLSGNKVSGILAEYDEQAGRRRLVVGIGLNVTFDPSAEAGLSGATSLASAAGRPIAREDVAIALFKRHDMWYRSLQEDPDAVFAEWKARLATIGRPVIVVDTESEWEGVAVGVERIGGLKIRIPNGDIRTVYAADVSVRTRPLTAP